jgi:GNAT superfamily N-acetyltransferase
VSFTVVTLSQRPELGKHIDRISRVAWPEFMLHADTCYWGSLYTAFDDFQVLLSDPGGTVVAFGHTIPFVWDGTPEDLPDEIDRLMERATEAYRARHTPTALSALAALVAPEHQRRGLSSEVLRAMSSLAAEHGMHSLVAPVRPTLKGLYPLTPIERYARWTRDDGSPFDPWLRVHWRLGAEQLRAAPKATTITGTVAQWEEWTGMSFPESGAYVVPGALQPVSIDRERNSGCYEDPIVWMRHSATPTR